eukprot:scpid66565/ scgid25098/ 
MSSRVGTGPVNAERNSEDSAGCGCDGTSCREPRLRDLATAKSEPVGMHPSAASRSQFMCRTASAPTLSESSSRAADLRCTSLDRRNSSGGLNYWRGRMFYSMYTHSLDENVSLAIPLRRHSLEYKSLPRKRRQSADSVSKHSSFPGMLGSHEPYNLSTRSPSVSDRDDDDDKSNFARQGSGQSVDSSNGSSSSSSDSNKEELSPSKHRRVSFSSKQPRRRHSPAVEQKNASVERCQRSLSLHDNGWERFAHGDFRVCAACLTFGRVAIAAARQKDLLLRFQHETLSSVREEKWEQPRLTRSHSDGFEPGAMAENGIQLPGERSPDEDAAARRAFDEEFEASIDKCVQVLDEVGRRCEEEMTSRCKGRRTAFRLQCQERRTWSCVGSGDRKSSGHGDRVGGSLRSLSEEDVISFGATIINKAL